MNKELKSLKNDIEVLHRLSMKTKDSEKELKDWILLQQIRTFARIDKLRDAEMARQRQKFFTETVDK